MAKRFKTLTDEEITKIIEQLDEYGCAPERKVILTALYVLMSNLGLRVSEALSLRWKDLNLEAGYMTVKTLKSGGRTGAKGKHVEDDLPLDPHTITALRACRNGGRPSDLIFPVSRQVAYNVWQRLMALAQVRPVKMHALRHSAVTRWLEQTQDLAFARALARHTNLQTTSQYVECRNVNERFQQVRKIGAKAEPQPSAAPPLVVPTLAPSQAVPVSKPPPVPEPTHAPPASHDDMLARMERIEEAFLTMVRMLSQVSPTERPAPPPEVADQPLALADTRKPWAIQKSASPLGLRDQLRAYGLDSPAELGRAIRTTRQHAWRLLAGERYGVVLAKRIAAAVRQPWPEILEWQDGVNADQAEAAERPAGA